MVIDFYNRNGGGGGGTADYATLAGESNKTKLLEGGSALPQSANTGDVVAIAPNPTRGLRSARTLGIYQYDGTNWNKIEGEGSSAYKIELSTPTPDDFTSEDIDALEAFCAAADADPSIEEGAYLFISGNIYRNTLIDVQDLIEGKLQHYIFSYIDAGYINSIDVSFENGVYSTGSHYGWYGETLIPFDSFPSDPVEGQIANYDDGNGNIGLYRYDDEYGWDFIRTDMLKPKSSLPVESEDGAVYALSSSGYGIYQAQSAHTGQGWFNYNGKSVPSGFTQIRVPYNDTVESNLVHFKTDPNGEGDCNIYWHPENSSNRYWDGLPNDPAQNDGEFSTTDAWGNTMVGTKVGDYIVVTFGAAVVDGGDPNDPMRADNHTEIYTTDSITDYKSVVMSNSINSIVKLTQAEYDALVSGGTVDENTFYLIVAEPQPQSLGVWSDDGNGTYTFQMLDTDPASWDSATQIGELLGIDWPHASSDPIDVNVYLSESNGSWAITTNIIGIAVSDEPHYDFTDGTQDEWVTGLRTSEASSESNITVSWDGTDTFTFYSADSDYPLSMTTIDPSAE